MNLHKVLPGYHQIKPHGGIFKEKVHDAYTPHGKLSEPTICPTCGAVYHQGGWRWMESPPNPHKAICPACHRIQDDYPAGFLTFSGKFFATHREEIMHLVQNHERHERAEHPLQRIIASQEIGSEVVITTTDIHLARGIGEAVHHAYQGNLEYHYNPSENLLRVYWER